MPGAYADLQEVYEKLSNFDIEQGVIGGLFIKNSKIPEVCSIIKPEYFFWPVHQRIFQSIVTQFSLGRSANPVTLQLQFANDPDLAGPDQAKKYLVALASGACAPGFIADYCEAIKELYKRRYFLSVYTDVIEELKVIDQDGKTSADIVTAASSKCLDQALEKNNLKLVTIGEVTDSIANNMGNPANYYETGIECLDRGTQGGLYGGKTYCFAARPKHGKTTMLGTIHYNMSSRGVPVLYIAAEMGVEEIHRRNLCRVTKLPEKAFTAREVSAETRLLVDQYRQTSQGAGIMVDAAGLHFDDLKQILTLAQSKYGIVGYFLDYLQIVEGKDSRESDAGFQERVTKWMHQFGKKSGLFGVYAAQLNRQGDVRGSDGAIMNADQVWEVKLDREKGTGWLKQLASRYSALGSIGDDKNPAIRLHKNGPHFKDAHDTYDGYVSKEEMEETAALLV